MNGASKGTSGDVDLGTVITAHQDISGKADKSAAIGSLSLSLNSTDYKITLSGTKVDGTTFTVSDVIDLPLESVVVNGSYDDTTKKVVLTLKNGNTVDFSIADLIAGLQSEITSTNKLSADLIADGTTNKVVTATEKSTWNGKQDAISDLATIRSNAEAGAAKVSNVQSDWNATTGAAVILNKPTIPAAPGTLKTNNTTAQTASASEALSGTINLHKVAKTGTYSDLIGTPTIPTESTVSGWGFTKNSGTVTGVKMNGTTNNPTSGVVDLGAVITSETSLSKGTTTGSGNAVTDISVSGHQITLTKGSTFLTSETQLSKGTTSGSGNVVTDLSVSGHTVTLTKGSNVPVATSANAGKIPMITSSGGWEYVTPSAIYSGSATPNNNTGNNGDVYLQM